MAEAKKIALPIASGVVLNNTEYEAQGRWTSTSHVRFVDGLPEKIGGWEQWNEPGDELTGTCRKILCWQDFNYNQWHAFGCTDRLIVFKHDKTRTNITPYAETGTLTDPFTTTAGSNVVEVADTAHGLIVGQYVNFSGAATVGSLTLNGEFQVASVVDTDNYTILHTSAASANDGPGGGTVTYKYELAPGSPNVTAGGGYGIGPYGEGTYGTERPSTTYIQLPRTWSLDQYGQYLLAMPSNGGLYQWTLNVSNRAAVVTNAPGTGLYMFVTSERIVVVLGADGDFMTMKWCDDDDNTVWTPADDNTANIRKLQEGSRLMAGCRMAQGINLVWSDTATYLMQWTGTNIVYSTRVIATNCGLVGPEAFIVVDGIAYWMAPTAFQMYGGQLSMIPRWEEVRPVFERINADQRYKITAHYNPEFREIWWLYPSAGETDGFAYASFEPDRYIMVNIDTWDWSEGPLDRTAFGLRNVAGTYVLLATGSDGVVYQHESGVDADGEALDWYIESGFFDIDKGNAGLNIDGYIPDFARQAGAIDITFTSRDLPEDTAVLDTVTGSIAEGDTVLDLRHFARQSKIKLSQTDVVGGDFALGSHRIEVGGTTTKRHD